MYSARAPAAPEAALAVNWSVWEFPYVVPLARLSDSVWAVESGFAPALPSALKSGS